MLTEETKYRFSIGLNVATILSLLIGFASLVSWRDGVNHHIDDESIHYDIEVLNEKFTPRRESDVQIDAITKQLDAQNEKLDLILKFIQDK